MKTKLLILMSLMLSGNNVHSQKNLDSLLVVARNTKDDSVSVAKLNIVAYFYIFKDTGRAYKILQEAKNKALNKNFYYGYVELTNTEGVYYDVTGNRDSAKILFTKAQKLSRQKGILPLEVRSTNNLGMLNWNQGNFRAALDYFFKALSLNDKVPESPVKTQNCVMYNNIGLIYQEMNLFDKALQYHKMAYDFRVAKKRDIEIPTSLHNMAICYKRLGRRHEATAAYREGMRLSKKYSNIPQYYQLLEGYAGMLIEEEKYEEAIKNLLEVSSHPPEIALPGHTILAVYSGLAVAYNSLNRPQAALEYGKKGLELIEKDASLKSASEDFYLALSQTFYMLGDIKNGQKYNTEFAQAVRERFSESNAEEIAGLEVKFETEKKEKQIAQNKADMIAMQAEAKQKNQMIMIAVFSIVFLSVTGYLLYRQQRLKNRQLEKEFELKSALAEIENQNRLQEQRLAISRDLHDNIGAQLTFIISTLDSLKYRLHETVPTVGTKLEGISNFTRQTIIELRDTIWAMNTSHITFEDLRVRILNFIEKAREANESIDFKFSIDPSLADMELSSVMGMNIYRTIQEGLNNAIKHSGATGMEIDIFDDGGMVRIIMRDNGRGFDSAATPPGNGLQNMEKRIEGIGGTFNLASDPDKGTAITIYIGKQIQSA